MEQEIDEIFLNTKEPTADDVKIDNLKKCTNKIPSLYPYADIIFEQVEEIRRCFAVYDIQLEALASELEGIQTRNKILEIRNANNNTLYTHLKELCIALSLDEGHFYVLENGSFSDISDLAKMEKSLAILGSVNLARYKLRIVSEKIAEITENQRNFLKRFVTFLRKLFIRSESSGELRVHRALYKSIAQYKFIYTFSKIYEDYYSIMCSAYLAHSKKIYELEFENHLNSIYDLVDDSEKLHICFDVLTKSYESLIICETDFIKMMDINVSIEEIFGNINSTIVEFVGEMFKKSRLATLVSVGIILNTDKKYSIAYENLKKDLNKRYETLVNLYLKSEAEVPPSFQRMDRLNFVIGSECSDAFKQKLLVLYLEKLKTKENDNGPESAISKLQLLYCIESSDKNLKKTIESELEKMPQLIISYVYSADNEPAQIKYLIKMVDEKKPGASTIMRHIRSIVLEHSSNANKNKYETLFSENKDVLGGK